MAGRARLTMNVSDVLGRAACHVEVGNFDAATKLLVKTADSTAPNNKYVQAALATNSIRNGRLGDAVFRLTCLLEDHKRKDDAFRHSLERLRAYALAVGGAVELAEQQRSSASWPRSPMTPLRAILLCKARRYSELHLICVENRLSERLGRSSPAWMAPRLGRHGERVIALLSAFASAKCIEAPESSRQELDNLLQAARPVYATEYDYLKSGWPELATFMEEHDVPLRMEVRLAPSIQFPHRGYLGSAFSVSRRAFRFLETVSMRLGVKDPDEGPLGRLRFSDTLDGEADSLSGVFGNRGIHQEDKQF